MVHTIFGNQLHVAIFEGSLKLVCRLVICSYSFIVTLEMICKVAVHRAGQVVYVFVLFYVFGSISNVLTLIYCSVVIFSAANIVSLPISLFYGESILS